MRRVALLLVTLAVAASSFAEDVVVRVGHGRLDPAEVTVAVGTAVTFLNEDEMPGGHTIVAADGSFASPGLAKGETWSHTFEKPGVYSYSIKEHPAAKGQVIVK
jgi:plastocyanin